jgi:hypothetical protein
MPLPALHRGAKTEKPNERKPQAALFGPIDSFQTFLINGQFF